MRQQDRDKRRQALRRRKRRGWRKREANEVTAARPADSLVRRLRNLATLSLSTRNHERATYQQSEQARRICKPPPRLYKIFQPVIGSFNLFLYIKQISLKRPFLLFRQHNFIYMSSQARNFIAHKMFLKRTLPRLQKKRFRNI